MTKTLPRVTSFSEEPSTLVPLGSLGTGHARPLLVIGPWSFGFSPRGLGIGICATSPEARASLRLRLRPLLQVLLAHRRSEVHVVDVRQRAEPRQDVGELLLQVLPGVLARQRSCQLPDFLREPQPRPGRAALAVDLFVEGGDVALESE